MVREPPRATFDLVPECARQARTFFTFDVVSDLRTFPGAGKAKAESYLGLKAD